MRHLSLLTETTDSIEIDRGVLRLAGFTVLSTPFHGMVYESGVPQPHGSWTVGRCSMPPSQREWCLKGFLLITPDLSGAICNSSIVISIDVRNGSALQVASRGRLPSPLGQLCRWWLQIAAGGTTGRKRRGKRRTVWEKRMVDFHFPKSNFVYSFFGFEGNPSLLELFLFLSKRLTQMEVDADFGRLRLRLPPSVITFLDRFAVAP